MNEINTLFFELIRVAIGTQLSLSRQPSPNEWTTLYKIAKKQSLVGICFAGVQRLCISETSDYSGMNELQYLTWMGMAAKIQQRNEVVNAQCVEVQQMIEKEGFRTFIMKGQGNAALYKVSKGSEFQEVSDHSDLSLLRQSGDIDIYLDGGFEKVNNFVQRTHPTNEINELEIHYHCFARPSTGYFDSAQHKSGEPTEVEIHYRPFIMRNPFKNRKLQRFFAEAMRFDNKVNLPNGVGSINVPTIEFNLVHQLVHIYHHLFTEGIGMRQLLDYYMLLRSVEKGKEGIEKVKKVISELGLDRFASALMWVLGEVFGLSIELMPWQPCETDGRIILTEVMKSGNFGKQDSRAEGMDDSKWKSFWFANGKTFRFWKFDHWAWFWSPLWRVYHNIWKKTKGFE